MIYAIAIATAMAMTDRQSHLGKLRENRNPGPRPPRSSIGVLLCDTIELT